MYREKRDRYKYIYIYIYITEDKVEQLGCGIMRTSRHHSAPPHQKSYQIQLRTFRFKVRVWISTWKSTKHIPQG